jgi:hypothetical protein
VTVADWDSDGRPDVVFTTTKATCLYIGSARPDLNGSLSLQRFALPGQSYRMTGGLAVADWDGDGRLDVLTGQWYPGESGRISWYRNIGRPGSALLEEPRTLVPGSDGPVTNGAFAVTDWDRDGKLDLVVTRVERYQPAASDQGRWACRSRLSVYPGR